MIHESSSGWIISDTRFVWNSPRNVPGPQDLACERPGLTLAIRLNRTSPMVMNGLGPDQRISHPGKWVVRRSITDKALVFQ